MFCFYTLTSILFQCIHIVLMSAPEFQVTWVTANSVST